MFMKLVLVLQLFFNMNLSASPMDCSLLAFLLNTTDGLNAKLQYDSFIDNSRFSEIKIIANGPIRITEGMDPIKSFEGYGFYRILRAKLDNHDVFIKYPSRNFHSQHIFALFFSDHAICPKYLGYTGQSGSPSGLVFEWIEGMHLNSDTVRIPESIRITRDTLRRLEEIEKFLIVENITVMGGLGDGVQFRLGLDGSLFLIDPEDFIFTDSSSETSLKVDSYDFRRIKSLLQKTLQERSHLK